MKFMRNIKQGYEYVFHPSMPEGVKTINVRAGGVDAEVYGETADRVIELLHLRGVTNLMLDNPDIKENEMAVEDIKEVQDDIDMIAGLILKRWNEAHGNH